MTKKEKVKAFFNKHKKGFIVGSVGLVTTIVGLVAYDKGWKDASHSDYVRVKDILESAIETFWNTSIVLLNLQRMIFILR